MSDLLQNLYYIRDLLKTMEELSKEKSRLSQQGKAIIPLKQPKANPKFGTIIAGIITTLIIIDLIVFYIVGGLCVRSSYREERMQYGTAMVKDEISWSLEHLSADVKYPGFYEMPEPELEDFVTVGMVGGVLTAAVLTIIVLALIPWIRKRIAVAITNKNRRIEEENKQITEQNRQIMEHNNDLSQKIERVQKELVKYSQEYERNADSWYPRDYATHDALDFFIHEAQNHMVNTIQDAVLRYREELDKRENKALFKQQTDAMIKQQKLTNILQGVNAAINLSTNITTQQILDVSRNTNAVAHQNLAATNAVYGEARRAADYLGNIDSKIR